MTEREALQYLKSGYYADSKLREAIRIVVAMAERNVEEPKVERKSHKAKETEE